MLLPKPKSAPGLLLYGVTLALLGLGLRIVWVLVDQNIEALSEANGLDNLLPRYWPLVIGWLAANGFWLSVVFAFFLGATLALWAYVALPTNQNMLSKRGALEKRSVNPSFKRVAGSVAHAPGDIVWEWEHEGRPVFLGLTRVGYQEPLVTGLQVRGINNTDEPIEKVSGYVQSLLSNERNELGFVIRGDRIPPDQTYGIPPRAAFIVASENHTPAAIFLDQWAPFRFVFEYDGKVYSRDFSREECKAVIDNFLLSSNPPKAPTVHRREGS